MQKFANSSMVSGRNWKWQERVKLKIYCWGQCFSQLHLLFKIATNFLSALYWSWRCTKNPKTIVVVFVVNNIDDGRGSSLSAKQLEPLFAIVHWLTTVTACQTSGKIRGKIERFLECRGKRQQVSYCADSTKAPLKRAFHLLKRLVLHPEDLAYRYYFPFYLMINNSSTRQTYKSSRFKLSRLGVDNKM